MKSIYILVLILGIYSLNTDFDCIQHRKCSRELQSLLQEKPNLLFYCVRESRIKQHLLNVEDFIDCLRTREVDLVKCAEDNCL
ncbi:hypothetical protein pb186bvf_015048 [Paramecium bursaria]